jgi:hypothetical protein
MCSFESSEKTSSSLSQQPLHYSHGKWGEGGPQCGTVVFFYECLTQSDMELTGGTGQAKSILLLKPSDWASIWQAKDRTL